MKTNQIEAMLTLTAEIAREVPDTKLYTIPRNVAKLQRLASSLHKRYEDACSYEWACAEGYKKRTGKLEERVCELAKELGVVLALQRDPRGWPVIVTVAGKETRLG